MHFGFMAEVDTFTYVFDILNCSYRININIFLKHTCIINSPKMSYGLVSNCLSMLTVQIYDICFVSFNINFYDKINSEPNLF